MKKIILKCVACSANLPIPIVSFKYGIPNITCPQCKTTFKPGLETQSTVRDKQRKPNHQTAQATIIHNPIAHGVAWLELQAGKGTLRYDLTKNRNVVGRKATNSFADVSIETEDKSMSRQHFIITKKVYPGRRIQYVLSDAGSSNYTYLKTNEMTLLDENDEYILENGDQILAGNTTIVFKTSPLRSQQSS